MPDSTLTLLNVAGGKKSKDRLTVLFTCNMDGSEKRCPLVIGKSANPRCLRGVKNLPVGYKSNKNAWMTSVIFTEMLQEWDAENRRKKRKILLLLDNCTAHPEGVHLTNIQLQFLPSNTTSIMQPLDQGIIHSTKAHYRRCLRRRIISLIDDGEKTAQEVVKSINVLDACHMVATAWSTVSTATIQNCFKKGGFTNPTMKFIDPVYEEDIELPTGMNEQEFLNWVNVDSKLPVVGEVTDADIVKEIQNHKQRVFYEEDSDFDNDTEDMPLRLPSSKEVNNALQILRTTLEVRGGSVNDYSIFYK